MPSRSTWDRTIETQSDGHILDVIFHVPHSSVEIGPNRGQFVLDDAGLELELLRMTDRYTDEFVGDLRTDAAPGCASSVVRFGLSRLVVDVERYRDDDDESIAKVGMGAIYERTHDGRPLRRDLTDGEREALLGLYDEHHTRLAGAVRSALAEAGRCLILDMHSFPSQPLPCDADQSPGRADICLGTDPSCTPPWLVGAAHEAATATGWSVTVNRPYAGTMVPALGAEAGRETRLYSLMIEVNRSLYMDERSGGKLPCFAEVQERVAGLVQASCAACARAQRIVPPSPTSRSALGEGAGRWSPSNDS